VLALVFLLPALEVSTLLGVISWGEIGGLIGGAVAHEGNMRRQADDSVGESAARSTRRSMSGRPPGVPPPGVTVACRGGDPGGGGVQVALPESLTFGPHPLLPSVELVLLAVVLAANPNRLTTESRDIRLISIVLIGVIGAANAVSLGLLVDSLLKGAATSGRLLVLAALGIWLTNVVCSRWSTGSWKGA